MIKIRLLKSHIHGGREYGSGDELILRPDQAERLIGMGIAESRGGVTPPLPNSLNENVGAGLALPSVGAHQVGAGFKPAPTEEKPSPDRIGTRRGLFSKNKKGGK